MSSSNQLNINGKSYRRLSGDEIESEVKRFKFPNTHRIIHPTELTYHLLTYYYEFEVISLPAESLSIHDLINFFGTSLKSAAERGNVGGNKLEKSENLDENLRMEMILHHVKNLPLIAHNTIKDMAGVKMAPVSYFVTAGGVYDNKKKELVLMAPGKAGRFSCKWGDGFSKDGETKLVRGEVYTDIVVVTDEEASMLRLNGIKEFNLYECLIYDQHIQSEGGRHWAARMPGVLPSWPWKRQNIKVHNMEGMVEFSWDDKKDERGPLHLKDIRRHRGVVLIKHVPIEMQDSVRSRLSDQI